MFNHLRTLLLNVNGSNAPGLAFPGEEGVPADFRAVPLPGHLAAVRAVLFGAAPDRLMLNYRLHQLMTLVHATELAEHALALDPRVTYTPGAAFDPALFGVRAEGSARSIQFAGAVAPDDARGRLLFQWRVEAETGGRVTVRAETPPADERTVAVAVADALTEAVTLGQGVRAAVDPTPGSVWYVTAGAHPGRDLSAVLAGLVGSLGEPRLLRLFGVDPPEPYRTFRALFFDHPALPYRLGGAVLAAGYRTHEIWRKEA